MAGFYFVFSLLGFNVFAIIAALAAGVIITGALHIDGFIDCADAFFVSDSKQRALDILKDSRVGAYGAIACVFLFLAKASLLFEITTININVVLPIIFMPVAGKIPVLISAYYSKYARENGSGKSIITHMSFYEMLIALILILISLVLAFFINGIVIFVAMIILGFIYVAIGKKKIGGATGDLLGSANETGEMLFLFIIFVLNKFGGFIF